MVERGSKKASRQGKRRFIDYHILMMFLTACLTVQTVLALHEYILLTTRCMASSICTQKTMHPGITSVRPLSSWGSMHICPAIPCLSFEHPACPSESLVWEAMQAASDSVDILGAAAFMLVSQHSMCTSTPSQLVEHCEWWSNVSEHYNGT